MVAPILCLGSQASFIELKGTEAINRINCLRPLDFRKGDIEYLGTPSNRIIKDVGSRIIEVDTRASPDNADACGCSGKNSFLNEVWNLLWR